MALKLTPAATLTDEQWLEHLKKLCTELQSALDQAADQRLHLQELQQLAESLCNEVEANTRTRRKKR